MHQLNRVLLVCALVTIQGCAYRIYPYSSYSGYWGPRFSHPYYVAPYFSPYPFYARPYYYRPHWYNWGRPHFYGGFGHGYGYRFRRFH